MKHNASRLINPQCLERFTPTPAAKIRIKNETTKNFDEKMYLGLRIKGLGAATTRKT